jgi:hypothetical protein
VLADQHLFAKWGSWLKRRVGGAGELSFSRSSTHPGMTSNSQRDGLFDSLGKFSFSFSFHE